MQPPWKAAIPVVHDHALWQHRRWRSRCRSRGPARRRLTTDYTNFSLGATIPAGQASTTITVTPIDDALIEGPETVVLTLTDTSNYNLGAAGTDTATVTIFDTIR